MARVIFLSTGEDFLINQSETRMAYGGYVC
jgi:hypothetical protein